MWTRQRIIVSNRWSRKEFSMKEASLKDASSTSRNERKGEQHWEARTKKKPQARWWETSTDPLDGGDIATCSLSCKWSVNAMVFLAIVRPHMGSTQKEKDEQGIQIYVFQLRQIVGSLGHFGQLFTKSIWFIVCSPFLLMIVNVVKRLKHWWKTCEL